MLRQLKIGKHTGNVEQGQEGNGFDESNWVRHPGVNGKVRYRSQESVSQGPMCVWRHCGDSGQVNAVPWKSLWGFSEAQWSARGCTIGLSSTLHTELTQASGLEVSAYFNCTLKTVVRCTQGFPSPSLLCGPFPQGGLQAHEVTLMDPVSAEEDRMPV